MDFKKTSVGYNRIFFTSLIICSVISAMFLFVLLHHKGRVQNEQMRYLASVKGNRIRESVSGLLYKAETLATLVKYGGGIVDDFNRVATLITSDPLVKNILLAPEGIVKQVYPLDGNETILDINLMDSDDWAARAAMAKKTLSVGGPFDAIQGGKILVGRYPVYLPSKDGSKFWGITSVSLHYPEVLSSVNLEDIKNLGYSYQIWQINPVTGKKQIIAGDDSALPAAAEAKIQIMDANWTIGIAPAERWYQDMEFILCAVGVFAASAILSMALQNYFKLKGLH